MTKKRMVVVLLIILGIILLFSGLFLVPARQVSKINLYVDQLESGHLVYDPYGGDEVKLQVGQEVKVSLDYDIAAKLVFTKCSYDKNIIKYEGKTIIAKDKGETELICHVVFNSKVKSEPISIKVS